MTKRIKHISELPSWFQLKKYEGAEKLNAAGWYEQLQIRKDCLFFIDLYLKNEKYEPNPLRSEALKLIRQNPIVDAASNEILSNSFLIGGFLPELKAKNITYALGIYSITPREFIKVEQSIVEERRRYLKLWWSQFEHLFSQKKRMPPKPTRYQNQPWFDEPLYKSTQFGMETSDLISIDLRLTDNILLEHFKQYLATRRTDASKTNKRYRQPDFNDWIRFGILPYLDLQIWEQEAKVRIPNRVMADAIYPRGEGGEETVRKTTASLAEQLLTNEQLSMLGAQAALEIAEQNHL